MTKKQTNNLLYHNMLNRFVFKDFNAVDYNLFFTICYFAVKSKKGVEISLSFEELRDFLPQEKNKKRFYDNVVKFAIKLNSLKTTDAYFDDEGYRNFSISSFFEEICVKEKEERIYFKIKEKSLFLIYDVFANYTKIDIKDFCSIGNKYAKNLYRLLKQWESTGEFIIPFNEFNLIMGIPDSYNLEKIENKVIKPSIILLSGNKKENDKIYFKDLNYQKIKEKGSGNIGRGGQVKEFVFYFDVPEERKEIIEMKKWGRRISKKAVPPPPNKRDLIQEISF